MRQRLGIASALLRRPRLLLLDEPATGLDPAGMRDMRGLIRDLAGQGITVLLSSHLLAEVEELCNRVAIIRSGRVAYEGSLADLRRQAGAGYRLRTTDDERARRVCAAQAGIEEVAEAPEGGLHFSAADEAAVGELTLALAESGALVLELSPRHATLEDLFFQLTEDTGVGERGGAGLGARLMPGVFTIYRWELRKLRAQKRTYLGLGAAALAPIIFAVALATQKGGPHDVAFGRYLHDTGLAMPLVLLLFGSIWMFPLITALVAGDIVAAEDRHSTLKTILTRSAERHQIFVAKALATASYAVLAIIITGVVAVIGGILVSGFNPITTLSALAGLGPARARARLGEPRRLPHTDPLDRVHRPPLLDAVSEQRRRGRRHADVLAARPADRHPPRARLPAPLPPQHAVLRLAGLPPRPRRLGADPSRALGLRALRAAGPRRRVPRLPAPRRRRRLDRRLCTGQERNAVERRG